MYPRSRAARRPAIAEPRPRPSGIGKDPRPFTSNPRNPPFTFPHPTPLSLGPAASPPLSRFLSACRSLFGALPSGSSPTTALRHPAKPQKSPLRVICDISLHALSHAAFVLTTLRPADSRHPRTHHPLQIGTALPLACVCVLAVRLGTSGPISPLTHLFLHPTSAASHKPTWPPKAHLQPGTLTQFLHTLGHRCLSCNLQPDAAQDRLPKTQPVSSRTKPAQKVGYQAAVSSYTSRRTAQVTARSPLTRIGGIQMTESPLSKHWQILTVTLDATSN
ncbi:hypothetical protein FJTKL_04256 [Diaporthe vaccinii]|uniref:Uncharacterized protein n=1 Tax=Diaporthe vaccinii TaxID=105482 RepID=A0ABR4F0G9_9PEZI